MHWRNRSVLPIFKGLNEKKHHEAAKVSSKIKCKTNQNASEKKLIRRYGNKFVPGDMLYDSHG